MTTAVLALLAASVTTARAEMQLTSPDMAEGGSLSLAQVFNGFGCEGGNLSPAFDWTGAPEGTKSFVLTAYDPDAPTGSGWWHWTVFNIPADTTDLPGGASVGAGLPEGAVEGRTDFGAPGFGGACPPPGDAPHHYVFTLFALKEASLPLDEGASGAMVGFMARANAIESATLTATYGR
ncbi:YbhB/YbcL family Raf kinase inhibitor-like protein [Frigidibacter sp. RF13]|nr:YbhB/YbcL family Raf kinase inhibitor-like protein [Frigidibacter sp. RF13]